MEQIKEILNRTTMAKSDLNYNNISKIDRQVRDYNEAEGIKNAGDIYNCEKCKNKGIIAFNYNENFMTKSIPLLRGVCYNNKRL